MAGGSGAQDLRWNFRATIFFRKQKKEAPVNTTYDAGKFDFYLDETGGCLVPRFTSGKQGFHPNKNGSTA